MRLVTCLLLMLVGAPAARAAEVPPADTLPEVWTALSQCWRSPAGSEGFEVALRFGITPAGALRGPPMVTYSKRIGTPVQQRDFAAATVQALVACTPVKVTPSLGRVIGQRVIIMRFRGGSAPLGL